MTEKLKELEEEVQLLLIESKGEHTKEIQDLCKRIDEEKEFIKNRGIKKIGVKKIK